MRKVLAVARFLVLAFELGCTDDPVAREPETKLAEAPLEASESACLAEAS